MIEPIRLDQLDDRSVLLILSRLGLELRGGLPEEQVDLVSSEADARDLIAAAAGQFLKPAEGETGHGRPAPELQEESDTTAAARQVLALLSLDQALRPRLETLVASPPRRARPELDPSVAVPILLGTIASWLQTRLKIDEDEQGFRVDPDSVEVDRALLQDVLRAAMEIEMKLG